MYAACFLSAMRATATRRWAAYGQAFHVRREVAEDGQAVLEQVQVVGPRQRVDKGAQHAEDREAAQRDVLHEPLGVPGHRGQKEVLEGRRVEALVLREGQQHDDAHVQRRQGRPRVNGRPRRRRRFGRRQGQLLDVGRPVEALQERQEERVQVAAGQEGPGRCCPARAARVVLLLGGDDAAAAVSGDAGDGVGADEPLPAAVDRV